MAELAHIVRTRKRKYRHILVQDVNNKSYQGRLISLACPASAELTALWWRANLVRRIKIDKMVCLIVDTPTHAQIGE